MYISTRGEASVLNFEDTLLAGLATDGGLYVPKQWPQLTLQPPLTFAHVAAQVLHAFAGDELPLDEAWNLTKEAYATFDHPDICPLTAIDEQRYLLELYHGPTLAFKDVAMQILSRLMERTLKRRNQRALVVGATSGDTGSAAIEAFRQSTCVDVVILFPEGRISPIQQRQMTTMGRHHVHPVAVEGTFDDAQAMVKALFNHNAQHHEWHLLGINSINWVRIAAQVTYYFTTALQMQASPADPIDVIVPTGNFGDIFAGYVAKKMGAPINRLVIATNSNDILARSLATGQYAKTSVAATSSPSMDIQVSSNFERLLFDVTQCDAARVRQAMAELQEQGRFVLTPAELSKIKAHFDAAAASEEETQMALREAYQQQLVIDPHTAVGWVAEAKTRHASSSRRRVILATASAAKFPQSVKQATGHWPELPARLEPILTASEHYTRMAANTEPLITWLRQVHKSS